MKATLWAALSKPEILHVPEMIRGPATKIYNDMDELHKRCKRHDLDSDVKSPKDRFRVVQRRT